MTNTEKTDIIKRCQCCPDLTPYVTAKGGVVILNGPFPMAKARHVESFIKQAQGDIHALVAEIERLETLIAFMDKIAPRADRNSTQPGITLSVAAERELRDRNHPLFVEENV